MRWGGGVQGLSISRRVSSGEDGESENLLGSEKCDGSYVRLDF